MAIRRRSRSIALALIGTVGLPACMPNAPDIVHDRYASLEDCSADWGRPEVCDRDDAAHPSSSAPWRTGGSGFVFRGPNYPAGERQEAQFQAREQAYRSGVLSAFGPEPGTRAIEHAVPSRGGFGSSAHTFGRLG
jgi:uncharacterized protein YgiB involved in biofilm formation